MRFFLIILINCFLSSHLAANPSDKAAVMDVFSESSIVADLFPSFLKNLGDIDETSFIYPERIANQIIAMHQGFPDSHFSIFTEKGTFRVSQASHYLIHNENLSGDQAAFLSSKGRYHPSQNWYYYQSTFSPDTLIEQGEAIGISLEKLRQPDVADSNSFDFTISDRVLTVKIPIMPGSLSDRHKRLLVQLEKTQEYDGIIFDLRGNPGGSDALFFEISQIVRPKHYLANQSYETRWIRSITSQEGFVKTIQEIVDRYPDGNFELILKKHQNILKEMRETNFQRTVEVNDWSSQLVSSKSFSPSKIALLVDASCASACELFVGMMQNDPNVQIIGTPTKGRFKYGNASTFSFLSGKIKIRPTTIANVFRTEGDEIWGFTPNLFIVNTEDQEAAARRWATGHINSDEFVHMNAISFRNDFKVDSSQQDPRLSRDFLQDYWFIKHQVELLSIQH